MIIIKKVAQITSDPGDSFLNGLQPGSHTVTAVYVYIRIFISSLKISQ